MSERDFSSREILKRGWYQSKYSLFQDHFMEMAVSSSKLQTLLLDVTIGAPLGSLFGADPVVPGDPARKDSSGSIDSSRSQPDKYGHTKAVMLSSFPAVALITSLVSSIARIPRFHMLT